MHYLLHQVNVCVKKIKRFFTILEGTILINNLQDTNTVINILATALRNLKQKTQVTVLNNKILFNTTKETIVAGRASSTVNNGEFKFIKLTKSIRISYKFSLNDCLITYLYLFIGALVFICLYSDQSEWIKLKIALIFVLLFTFKIDCIVTSSIIRRFLKKVYTQPSKRDKLVF